MTEAEQRVRPLQAVHTVISALSASRCDGAALSLPPPTRQVPDERVAECRVRESRVRVVVSSLVSSVYVRLRSSAFKINVAVQVADVKGIQRTVILTPEIGRLAARPPWPTSDD
jgi:hypothetical protein